MKFFQKEPKHLQTTEFRAFAWTLLILPLIQCLVAGLATPKPLSLTSSLSGFLFWICAIVPLWWLSHFCSKLILAKTGTNGMRLWIGLALGAVSAFVIAEITGYFYFINQIFSDFLGVFEAPFTISEWPVATLFSDTIFFGALGHLIMWLSANLSASFLLGRTLYEPETEAADSTPLFLLRLPQERRQDLLALRAQEHYIDVHTAGGSEMILYRFGDALQELAGTPGMQVHRSFWVAEGSIASYKRKSGQLFLTLHDGMEVPVSRSFLRDVEKSGFLPVPSG